MVLTFDNALVSTTRTPLAAWFLRFREHLDLTQVEFAALFHVFHSTYQRWEYGTSKPTGPAMALAEKLAQEHHFERPPDTQQRRGPRRSAEDS